MHRETGTCSDTLPALSRIFYKIIPESVNINALLGQSIKFRVLEEHPLKYTELEKCYLSVATPLLFKGKNKRQRKTSE